MGSGMKGFVNNQLLYIAYSEEKNIKALLKNWTKLERLSMNGDTVATCIVTDLKLVTGIVPSDFGRNSWERKRFDDGMYKGILSESQFLSIAYVLVLGYTQEELAYILRCSQQAINQNINKGIKKIKSKLMVNMEE